MATAKGDFELVPAASLIDLSQFSSPVLATAASRLASQQRIAERVQQPFNLVISNVPGPREPLYFAGAPLRHQYPVSIVTEGQGLNVTVQSYVDRIDFGLISDRELVPDLWDLADLHLAEIDRLLAACGLPTSATKPKAGKKRARAKQRTRAKNPTGAD